MKKERLPTKKVAATSITGAVSVLVVWIVGLFGVVVPPEIAAAFTGLLSGLAGYLTPERIEQAIDAVKGDD